ncbi:MAG: polymerase III, alpha subunit protein [Parcubacteria group bacterium GW2011_GWF2_44_8b]|nr:MAG: polymerase III, alpha subunit protein [Parcubacteria group bacterium GW2011_GWF2_44_8b]
MKALALTDSGNLYGAIEFYKECREQEIKPIIGVDFYVARRTRKDKEARVDNERDRLILLAENNAGYLNLLKLVTDSYLEGFYYKPRIDRELLEKYNDGLIAISTPARHGFAAGESGGESKWYREIFGERFYLGVTPQSLPNLKKKDENIVAIYDVHYLEPADRPVLDTLVSIQGQLRENHTFNKEVDRSFISADQAKEDFRNFPEAIENTVKIADRCNVELELGKWVFPNYVVESGKSYNEELRIIVYSGLEKKKLNKTSEIIERIEYELKIITDKGYAPYFLVAADLLRYAHNHGILTNTRGSAAGSMVTYLSGITTIDPIKYALPFERFLNPDRPSPPDIDLDIADDRRDELIEYARHKYGADHVAQIGTFGTMMARGAVRDVTRALGFSYTLGDQIAKLIPMGAQGFPMTLDRAMKENPDLKKLYEEDADTKTIIEMAKKIEGNARHVSVHAAGVVISPKPLVEYTPLQYDTKGEKKIITQYDMYSLDPNAGGEMTVGLLKFDFLGIRNLAIIAETLVRIEKIEGKKITIEKIPIDNKKTFEMLTRGETEGTFQLNGDGMTRALMELKPNTIHDINVMVALYRPGPMDNIREYIARKHGTRPITYLHPKMKDFLDTTYGVLVYQDDLLMTALEVAGYSWGDIDKFRKAVGKKIPEEMRKQHISFVKGCEKHGGMSKDKSEELWKLFEPFQGYGFNKAHAASYGHVAYITAYLKANFPAIYMSAVLTAESGDVEKIGVMIKECKRMGIEVLPPSINESFSQFTVVNEKPYKIRFGLTTIKNFGQGISSAITTERKLNGKFKDLADFLDRVKDKNLNKKSLESLIKCGALDEFGERGRLLSNIDNLLEYHRERMRAPNNQDSLFGLMSDTSTLPGLRLLDAPIATQKDKLLWEKELLGLYISGHPLEAYKDKLLTLQINIEKLPDLREGDTTVIAGIVEEVRDVLTKGNERMVFMRLADLSGIIEVAIFPRILNEFRSFIQPEACIAIKGKVSKRKGETSFIAEKIRAL